MESSKSVGDDVDRTLNRGRSSRRNQHGDQDRGGGRGHAHHPGRDSGHRKNRVGRFRRDDAGQHDANVNSDTVGDRESHTDAPTSTRKGEKHHVRRYHEKRGGNSERHADDTNRARRVISLTPEDTEKKHDSPRHHHGGQRKSDHKPACDVVDTKERSHSMKSSQNREKRHRSHPRPDVQGQERHSIGATEEQGNVCSKIHSRKEKPNKPKRNDLVDNEAIDTSVRSPNPSTTPQRRRSNRQKNEHGHSNTSKHSKGTTESGENMTDRTISGESANSVSNTAEDNAQSRRKSKTLKELYPPHHNYEDCLARYATASDPNFIRGKIRVMPKKDGMAFVSCDRGSLSRDVVIQNELDKNRALDGDYVYVELLPPDDVVAVNNGNEGEEDVAGNGACGDDVVVDDIANLHLDEEIVEHDVCASNGAMEHALSPDDFEDYDIGDDDGNSDVDTSGDESDLEVDIDDYEPETWQDDHVQRSLWNPIVKIRKPRPSQNGGDKGHQQVVTTEYQYKGRVVFVVPPKSITSGQISELNPGDESYRKDAPRRAIVGTLSKLRSANANRYLLCPTNKSLPRFMCHFGKRGIQGINEDNGDTHGNGSEGIDGTALYRAEYVYGTWSSTDRWPPCRNIKRLGNSCNVADETAALLLEHGVDHGEFDRKVLQDVESAVRSGRILPDKMPKKLRNQQLGATGTTQTNQELGWKPTPEMYHGRRDYRDERIFTIDPTTAKDLDDALHIKDLGDGRVEIGVHIADVSYFVKPDTAVDVEALKRATTVYLVDRTIPMLPRPLCEIACSLNENVERLAFSCVWRMNIDGTLENQNGKTRSKKDDYEVWYGRTVIKSCARLDYATAQSIIENKVATGEKVNDVDETLWPKSRQPTGRHTMEEIAADIRLMHRVAQARRKLRFQNGALALNGVKLAFQLDNDGESPLMCAPYPIRDSNRLVEEFMLLANYLVAQRLITHAGDLALLRHHPSPIQDGLQSLVDVAKESIGFRIDISSSQALQESLSRLGRECHDELVMQCVTELAMTPMRPAEYIAAGEVEEELWRHFALNIPYYTHFTSPIRRYADVMVHRLLQAAIDGEEAFGNFPKSVSEISSITSHCNDKRMASKKAQERSDRVFLSLFLRNNPVKSALGVVLSVGEKTFTVFVPSLGLNTLVYLDEQKDEFEVHSHSEGSKRRIVLTPKNNGAEVQGRTFTQTPLEVKVFAKLSVSCYCKELPPVDVKVRVVGDWSGC